MPIKPLAVLLLIICTSSLALPLPDKTDFSIYTHTAQQCSDTPVPSLLYKSPSSRIEARLPTLNIVDSWTSTHTSVDDVTLCTHTSADRLYMLRGMCVNWRGPLSAIVYLPLPLFQHSSNQHKLDQMRQDLTYLHDDIQRQGDCFMDITLVTEHLSPDHVASSYPYNALRNQALARSHTRLVMPVDVDYLMSQGMRNRLLEEPGWSALLRDTHINKDVVVVPSFETKDTLPIELGRAMAVRAVQSPTKGGLREVFMKTFITRSASYFDERRDHQPPTTAYDYLKWFLADRPYVVKFGDLGYEPIIIMARVHVPWFDERFRGYGWDKFTHMYQLTHSGGGNGGGSGNKKRDGFNLVAHPSAFAIHRPHAPSASYNAAFTITKVASFDDIETSSGDIIINNNKNPFSSGTESGDNNGNTDTYPSLESIMNGKKKEEVIITPNVQLKRQEMMAREVMYDVDNGVYPERGVSALAGCRTDDMLGDWSNDVHQLHEQIVTGEGSEDGNDGDNDADKVWW